MRKKIGTKIETKVKIGPPKNTDKTLHITKHRKQINPFTSSQKLSVQYDRFVNNQILQNCRRPQRRDWCGPTTIAETIQILLNKEYSVDQIAKMMNWSAETIEGGKLGTNSIVKGVETCSFNRIKSKVLTVKYDQNSWNALKTYINSNKTLIYFHEPGHHLLLTGYIEEPLIDPDDIWNHENVNKSGFVSKRYWLLKAEHNVKRADYITQGIIVPIEFTLVCKYLAEKKNCELVLFYI